MAARVSAPRARALAPLLLLATLAHAQEAPVAEPLPSADELVASLVEHARERQARIREDLERYSYVETQTEERLDKKGAVVETTTRVVSVVRTPHGVVRRTLSIDGKEPPPDVVEREERSEAAKRKAWEERQAQTPAAPTPAAPSENQGRRSLRRVEDLLKLSHFTVAGREELDGFRAVRVGFVPRRDVDPDHLMEKVVLASEGELWIDEESRHLLRMTARSVDNVRVMGPLGNVKRFRLDAEFRPASEGGDAWLPRRVETELAARVLFKRLRARIVTSYSDYRRAEVSAEAEVGPMVEPPPGGAAAP